jgi:hypothetical protein
MSRFGSDAEPLIVHRIWQHRDLFLRQILFIEQPVSREVTNRQNLLGIPK